MSLTNIGRLFKGVGSIKTDTIERKSTLDTHDVISDDTISNFCRYHAFGDVAIPSVKFYVRSSNGPFGPAMTSVVEEAKSLPENLISSFATLSFKEDENATEALDLIKTIRNNDIQVPEDYTKLFHKDLKTLRVITVVEDKEDKDRVIAILDYWSQLFLKPYHEALMGLLENNFWSNDATMDQTRSVHDLKKSVNILLKENPNQILASLDLKSATDLLPMHLQKRLFGSIFGQDRAEAWSNILVSIP